MVLKIPPIPLTAHHLRFTVRAETPIWFHPFRGSALRGALADQLRRSFCPESRTGQDDPFHKAFCPVCQLLSWEGDEGVAGDVRRPYALVPQAVNGQRSPSVVAPGECFRFGLTLFGERLGYLPYLILAVRAMGEAGVGQRGANGERGRFHLQEIEAFNPLTNEVAQIFAAGANSVRNFTLPVTHEQVMQASATLLEQVNAGSNRLAVSLRTPVRLIQGEHLVQKPLFFPLIKQIVLRVLDLCAQHAEGRPDFVLKRDLYPWADAVALVRDETEWWDVSGYSNRLQRPQVIGGLIGSATYHAEDWRPLLPWLVWGQSVQVGKNIVKGCGVLQVAAEGEGEDQWPLYRI